MNLLMGLLRLFIVIPVLIVGTLLILLLAIFRVRIRRVYLSAWPVVALTRFAMWLFGISFECNDRQALLSHEGFVFPNHQSYFDILMMTYLLPTRFLAAIEIKSWPLIGWIAVAIDTVFVNRESKEARQQARLALGQQFFKSPFPPIVLYPEGKISTTGELLPFRHGAFEIAIEEKIPYLPVALVYEPAGVVRWGDEHLLMALWRLASRPGPVHAKMVILDKVTPQPDDDPQKLAEAAYQAIKQVMENTE